MKVKDEKVYQDWKNNNTDPYGACIFKYTENWADAMEKAIEHGFKLEDVADELSYKVNVDGITGFMYGASVNILALCWIYGEELRRWHNKQYRYEGKGVANPAIIIFK